MQRTGRLDALEDGDDAIGLDADVVEAGHQRLQIRSVEQGDIAARLLGLDIGLRLDGGDAAREGFRLNDLWRFGDLHGEGAIADGNLRNADIGMREHVVDAETTPLQNPEHYQYKLDLPEIAEVWRRGSVISSWLLDLTADALYGDPGLESYEGHVSDSGEGRWTVIAAIDEAVPTPVLSAALQERFSSRGNADFANKILSAMRSEFGGHKEKPANKTAG